MRYHVNAKHAFAGPSGSASGLRPDHAECSQAINKSASDNLTNTIAKWIAKDCRPISIVEDSGFLDVLQVASQDSYYKPPSRATVMTKIHELYENEKEKRKEVLAQVNHIALTGDHWTSVSNNNYLGVTAHFISDTWELKSFALTILKLRSVILRRLVKNSSCLLHVSGTSRARRQPLGLTVHATWLPQFDLHAMNT